MDYKKFKEDFFNNFDIVDIKRNIFTAEGILTGYYEPVINAFSFPKKGSYPIYKHPSNISNIIDAEVTRKKINEGYLKNYNLEIAWVENEIEAFFLQIQGSGRLKLENQKIIKVRFAGSNNKKYTSLGKILIQYGHMEKKNIDMYKIKNWLYKNKDLSRKYMNMNDRYIYFEEYSGNIKGSSGLELVPNVSLAVDKRFIKSGEAIIVQSVEKKKDLFIGVAHDEGVAIKGYNRLDLFAGYGLLAEEKAAKLNKKILARKLIPKIK